MNKLEGILFLKRYGLKTVELINYNEIIREDYIINSGVSLRLSSLRNNIDVNLPSIHNCYNKKDIIEFYNKYAKQYEILIHKTVKPTMIGSISKYHINDRCIIVIETFKNFEQRKKGIVLDRIIFNYINETYIDLKKCTNKDYKTLVNIVKQIPFENFDLEFVKQDEVFVFTDFYCNKL